MRRFYSFLLSSQLCKSWLIEKRREKTAEKRKQRTLLLFYLEIRKDCKKRSILLKIEFQLKLNSNYDNKYKIVEYEMEGTKYQSKAYKYKRNRKEELKRYTEIQND